MAGAQQLTTASLYDLQGIIFNPATAGSERHAFAGVSFRSMWDGIDGSPQTGTVFGSTWIPSVKLGLAGNVYSDRTGPTKRTGISMSYAYHIPINDKEDFSFGIEMRGQQFSYDRAELELSLGNDPVLASPENRFKFDAGFGIAYTSDKLQVGASVSQLIQTKLDLYTGNLTTTEQGKLYRHYYFHGNYKWNVDNNTTIIPNVLVTYLPNAPTEFQGGVRVDYKQLFWWGLALRARQSWMLSAGVHIQKKLSIGYCFDLYSTPLSIYDKGANAHEVLLRYDFLK